VPLSGLSSRFARHGYWLALLAIAASTGLFLPGRDYFAKGQWALLYLLVILFVASAAGAGPAVLAAVLAFLGWDFFFLPPYGTFVIADVKDWLALIAFLVVGVIVGVQAGRMRDREARAMAREREAAALSRLSAGLVSETSTEAMADTVLTELVSLLDCPSATLFADGDEGLHRYCAAPTSDSTDAETARRADWAFRHDQPLGVPDDGGAKPFRALGDAHGIYVPVRSPAGVVGVLTAAARSNGRPYSAANGFVVASLANLIGAFVERQRLQEEATRAEAAREADRLKSSLLSSVSHELKTPLAALTATVSNLLESDVAWDEESVRDELQSIVVDVDRLSSSIGALLDLSRLEARTWEPHRELTDIQDVVAAVLQTVPAHERGRVRLDLPDDLPLVNVDFVQWSRVVRNLVENALLYSAGPAIGVGARHRGGSVTMWVSDTGPGVPEAEREAVFEKFYRSAATQAQAPSGTGLGLAITREIVRAHGGTVWVEGVEPQGARFVVSLPTTSGGGS
jgi:two-component system sensor histidine kinase KdpD